MTKRQLLSTIAELKEELDKVQSTRGLESNSIGWILNEKANLVDDHEVQTELNNLVLCIESYNHCCPVNLTALLSG